MFNKYYDLIDQLAEYCGEKRFYELYTWEALIKNAHSVEKKLSESEKEIFQRLQGLKEDEDFFYVEPHTQELHTEEDMLHAIKHAKQVLAKKDQVKKLIQTLISV